MATPIDRHLRKRSLRRCPPKPAQEWHEGESCRTHADRHLDESHRGGTPVRATRSSEITNLFFDDDPDVRMGAIMQFADVDPETTSAATHALLARLSTREMLALRLKSAHAAAERPSLKEMSDDALVARFEDAGLRQSATQFLDPIDEPEDQETQNRVAIEVVDVLRGVESARFAAAAAAAADQRQSHGPPASGAGLSASGRARSRRGARICRQEREFR